MAIQRKHLGHFKCRESSSGILPLAQIQALSPDGLLLTLAIANSATAVDYVCMEGSSSKPMVITFATCDGVHLDRGSGKYYLMGIFSNIRAAKFPVVHPQMFWFIILTEVTVGRHVLKISLGLPAEDPIMNLERPFVSRSPAHRLHLVNQINNLKFDKPGNYSAVVEVDEDPLLVSTFGVSA